MYFKILIALMIILFQGCNSKEDSKELIITTNSWIGYTPLFYAKQTGELKKLNIKLITNVSLAESSNIYDMGKADMITGTQHEYNSLNDKTNNIEPIILLDKSYGGDMVLSNKTVEQLKKSKNIIAYLEIDSINTEIIKEFMYLNGLDSDNIKFINRNQDKIQSLKNNKAQDILIVTYSPYDVELKKEGFNILASTKDPNSIVVIDAIFSKKNIINTDIERLKKLKIVIDNAIAQINNDRKKSYELVKPFLDNISYDEYLESLKLIKWINKPSKETMKILRQINFKSDNIIQ